MKAKLLPILKAAYKALSMLIKPSVLAGGTRLRLEGELRELDRYIKDLETVTPEEQAAIQYIKETVEDDEHELDDDPMTSPAIGEKFKGDQGVWVQVWHWVPGYQIGIEGEDDDDESVAD